MLANGQANRLLKRMLLALVCLTAISSSALAQEGEAPTGVVVFWTSMPTEAAEQSVEAFSAERDVDILWMRLSARALINRFITERIAGRAQIDVINATDVSDLEYLVTQEWIDDTVSELDSFGDYEERFKDANGFWVTARLNDIAILYNRDYVSDEEAPRTWSDLLDPKWEGKVAIGDYSRSGTAFQWIYTMVENYGIEYAEALADNGALIPGTLGAVRNSVLTGETPIGVASTGEITYAIEDGANIGIVWPEEGTLVAVSPIAIPIDAPNPAAARAFVEFLISKEGQEIIVAESRNYSARSDVAPPPLKPALSELTIFDFDYAEFGREKANVETQLNQIFGR